ncbi:MAG: DNA-3-methyladenine glycosylase [Acidimicrobiaceae bacterium]|nr:DNA-3-methyladenine glycosylase [Acidimicrobiaceae bacterium]
MPVHEDATHLELLVLEGAQAGLSWLTVLRRREGYRAAFARFDPQTVARFGPSDVERLVQDPGVIRHRGKLESAIHNARALLALAEEAGSFDLFVWERVGGVAIQGNRSALSELPASTPLSAALSKELRRRGFSFVGPTTCYSYLQAAGLAQDHLMSCHRWPALRG